MPLIPRSEMECRIGNRIRQRREEWGITQRRLAESINITYQQVQKYEYGKNRVSASMLHEIAHQLQVPIDYFFDPFGKDQKIIL